MTSHQITNTTQLVGLIGWPVDDSLTPVMHNAAFAQREMDWAHVPLPVQPSQIETALRGLIALNFAGVTVTAPHKQAVMRYIDELSDAARIIGTVNTIHIQDGKYYGYNTDAAGFLIAIEEAGFNPKEMCVAVLGAGGTARAVVYALARAGSPWITVLNRTAERAAFLVDDLAEIFPHTRLRFAGLNPESLATLADTVDMVVNTTSVGMHPQSNASPWPADISVPAGIIFCDLVYDPLETVFLQQAQKAGAIAIDGLGMFIHQGAFAFEKWTAQQAPIEAMRQACKQKLKSLASSRLCPED